jgi:hypothetical protein
MAVKITEQGILHLSTPIGEINRNTWADLSNNLRVIADQHKKEVGPIKEIHIVRPEDRIEKDALINLAKSELPSVRIIVQSEFK